MIKTHEPSPKLNQLQNRTNGFVQIWPSELFKFFFFQKVIKYHHIRIF